MILQDLYQDIIIDHGKQPRNFGRIQAATHTQAGYNPLCGDRLNLYLMVENGIIQDICFEGSGCAISIASASLMTEALKGKSLQEAENLFTDFHQLMMQKNDEAVNLGKLSVLKNVADFPMRVKCATLAWHTLKAAIHDDQHVASTE